MKDAGHIRVVRFWETARVLIERIRERYGMFGKNRGNRAGLELRLYEESKSIFLASRRRQDSNLR